MKSLFQYTTYTFITPKGVYFGLPIFGTWVRPPPAANEDRMRQIQDHQGHEVGLSVEDGLFVITHPEGKLRLYGRDASSLAEEIVEKLPECKFKAPVPEGLKPGKKSEVEIDPLNQKRGKTQDVPL